MIKVQIEWHDWVESSTGDFPCESRSGVYEATVTKLELARILSLKSSERNIITGIHVGEQYFIRLIEGGCWIEHSSIQWEDPVDARDGIDIY